MSLSDEQLQQYALACSLMEERIGELYIRGLSGEVGPPLGDEQIAALVAQRKAIFYELRDLQPDDAKAVAEAIRRYGKG
ncbi:hypothetical protein [Chitiniphilus shinanonensis]|uniref:hypothetical protein n=1 Tax=Chitiniphilus shinanonensis TaxID=553088 RepID=UPI0030540631